LWWKIPATTRKVIPNAAWIEIAARNGWTAVSKAVQLTASGQQQGEQFLTDLARRPDLVAGVHRVAVETFPDVPGSEPIWDLIELLFFAYRDFVSDPDEVLAKFGFGRAHHRVLHFVNRNPGMKVADLLELLRITKQSLGRVLKQLVDQGYIVQREGAHDRRQRLLHVTEKGRALALQLASLQTQRIAAALKELGPGAHEEARRFLAAMIDREDRAGVLAFIESADEARRRT